jgi:hypothetical protein
VRSALMKKRQKMYNKYYAKKTEIDGICFQSKAEANRYNELKLLQRLKQISDLQMQPEFELIPKSKNERACKYIADFQYCENGKTIVEDVKSKITMTPQYVIKRKLFKRLYPLLEHREIY